MIKYYFIFFLVSFVTNLFSQVGKKFEREDADEHFGHHNYLMALPIYKEVLKKDKENSDIQYRIAECYLNTNLNKLEAIKYLEFCSKIPKFTSEVWLKLGNAYRIAYKLEE